MATPEENEVFDRWVAQYPDELKPRFYPIPPEIAPAFEKQRRTFDRRKGELHNMLLPGRKDIKFHTDFTVEPFCDAVADVFEDVSGTWGLIAITKGAIMLPLEMFFNMFSHPEVIPGIGDSTKERRNGRHSEGLLTNYDDLILARRKAGRQIWPKSPIDDRRNETAQLCAEVVWSFIALHEIAHIVYGHIGFLRRNTPIPCFLRASHANYRAYLPASDLDQQAIELWADNRAISVSLGGFLAKSWNSILVKTFPEPHQKIFIWSFAMYTLFRIWELKTDPTDLWGDHPPTVLRFQMAMRGAYQTAASKVPQLQESQFQQAVASGMREAEKAIVYCGGTRLVPEDAVGTSDPRVASHFDTLADHFDNVLQSELPKYSYVSLNAVVP